MTAVSRELGDEATMSFGDHLEELRHRILLAAAPALPLAILFFFFSDTFLRWLVLPLRRVLERNDLPAELQALSPPEVLVVKLKLSVIFAVVAVGPWILWQAWLFVRPGLYGHERRFVHFLMPGSAVLTVAGVGLLYFVMLPLMLQVLVTVGSDLDLGPSAPKLEPAVATVLEQDGEVPIVTRTPAAPGPGGRWIKAPEMELWVAVDDEEGGTRILPVPRGSNAAIRQTYRVSTYVSFVLVLLLGIVIAFQMPLVIVLLGWLGLASPPWLRAQRKYALFVCGIVAAVITPADVVSMILMLVPLYALYELGILLLAVAPASAVAEGRVLRTPWSGPRASPDKPPGASAKPAEPAQAEGSVPRSPGGSDRADDRAPPPADGNREDGG